MPPPRLVLVRHGQSTWNRQNRFTGWEDPPLTARGRMEAKQTADILTETGATFDAAFTSYLRRAVETLWEIQRRMKLMWLPVSTDWRFNERHYGALQGKNKDELAQLHGAKKIREWRRSYGARPPAGGGGAAADHRYCGAQIPDGESLEETGVRVFACYKERVLPLLKKNKRVLIVAHGNVLRALLMHLDNISPADISRLEIPTGGAAAYQTGGGGAPLPPHRIMRSCSETRTNGG